MPYSKEPSAPPPAGGAPTTDKVYFFRYLVVSPAAVSFSEAQLSSAAYRALEQRLRKDLGATKSFAKEWGRLVKTQQALRSLPLKNAGSAIQLELPYVRPDKCAKAPPQAQ